MTDFFERLGLPRRFSIDDQELDRVYLALSRAIHPDYHITGSASELSASQDLSAAVNEAYNTLRDPLARANYLVNLEGGPSASEHKQLPPNFLAQMLEAREEVELARGSSEKTTALNQDFARRYQAIQEDIKQLFARYESLLPDDRERGKLRTQIRGLLNAGNYVERLLRDSAEA